jgi:DNA-binding transcriptional LysR family regulator
MGPMSALHGLDLADFRLLRVVAAAGSFTSAADVLHYSQGGVSRRVAQIERALGAPIFARMPRGVRPTPLGEVLLARADELISWMDGLADDLEATASGRRGRLRVGSFPTASSSLTPRALGRFRDSHPDWLITVVEGLSRVLVEQVATAALDLAVVSDYPTGSLDSSHTQLTELLDDELLVALPATHTRSRSRRLRLADLAEETWISAAPEGADTVLLLAAAEAGFEPRVRIQVASWTAKLGYVAAGFGVTIVPRLLAGPVPPDVVVKPLGDDFPSRTIFAALPDNPPAAAEALLDDLHAVVRQLTRRR